MRKLGGKLIAFVAACAMTLPVGALLACGDSSDSFNSGWPGLKFNTYTISYTVDGTTYKLEVKQDSPYKLTGIPEKAGYEFMGLYDLDDGGNCYVDKTGASVNNFTDKKNIVLYAQFLPKITFNENGGTDVDDIVQKAETAITLPGTTQKDCTFLGWYTEDGLEYKGGAMPEVGFTVTAKWKKQQNIIKSLTNGTQNISSSKTGVLFVIDLSEYMEAEEETNISFSVSYDLKVNGYISIWGVQTPKWFDFKFYSRNEVNDVYKIGEVVCEWGGGEYASVSNIPFNADLKGNRIYVAADSNTWAAGYGISNFSVNLQFTDII